MSYLRLTPNEFQAIWQVCHGISLSDEFFPVFKYFLVESLVEIAPDVSRRVAQLRRPQVELLFHFVRERRQTVLDCPSVYKRSRKG